MSNTRTINLGPLFIVWAVVWSVAAVIKENYSLFWVAAAPWLVWLVIAVAMMLFASLVIFIMYMKGEPITLTTPRKGSRVVQRHPRGSIARQHQKNMRYYR